MHGHIFRLWGVCFFKKELNRLPYFVCRKLNHLPSFEDMYYFEEPISA